MKKINDLTKATWKVKMVKTREGTEIPVLDYNAYYWSNKERMEEAGYILPVFEVPPFTFQARLKYHDYYKGRSAAGTIWFDEDDARIRYYMGMSSTSELFRKIFSGELKIVDGYIDGVWRLKKQGSAILICPL